MKTMTAFVATLAAGLALAPMAADAATITFEGGSEQGRDMVSYGGGSEALSGLIGIDTIRGQDTPRNAGERRDCNGPCALSFQTGAHLSTRFERQEFFDVNEYEWTGGGFLRILEPMGETLLTGTFVEPVTATRSNPPNVSYGALVVAGILENVAIREDVAAYYGVPNRGTGKIDIRDSDDFGGPGEAFQFRGAESTVTFSPVPVPAALPLMLTALAGLGLIRLRRMHA